MTLPHEPLELRLWREASRALELDATLPRLHALLVERVPELRATVVAHLDESRWEPLGSVGEVPAGLRRRRTLDARASAELRREPLRAGLGALDLERPLGVGLGRRPSDVVVLPLPSSRTLLYLVAARELPSELLADVASCVEPIDAAVAHDRRLHELARSRDAAEAENRALLSRLNRGSIVDGLVGEEGGLRGVMERVAQVAGTDVPVLLLGETGSGKEVIARAIHEGSPREAGPMVRVNCGAIPPQLLDSHLFGHEKGSFTGATETRRGWFERADGGTLMLDEVGELPLDAQVRLLRVLQEGAIERVGGQASIHVDVRVVAATHRDLYAMVREGRFREDLWYRLSVFPLLIPPLRERRQDLPALATHFATRAGMRLGGTSLQPTPSDLALLASYEWPGNVRELAAVMERAAILGHGKRLEVAAALGVGAQARGPSAPPPREVPEVESWNLDDAITRHLERALRKTRGRIEGKDGAAALVGVNPHTLRARMRKLGLDWSRFRA
ncbi:MAG: sigma 54-interacting transcriptional regulator [Sandaracinus sp.]|nr:sigma 54-interacting transcriptional regulator [Sandaracinus sp.]MCB9631194.1 sigma 54-interacting transcriptional regulator [Sandaracinus sp.]